MSSMWEEIINLGQFWSSSLLREQKNEITALNSKKSAAYRRAYSYLRSCGNLCAVIDSLMRKAIDEEKLRGAASRTVAALELEVGEWQALPVVTKAVGMTGKTELSTFKNNAKKLYSVGEFYGVGGRFLEELERNLKTKKISVRVSKDPICPDKTDGIFIEDVGVAFVVVKNSTGEESETENERFINPKRFIHTEKMREFRGEMRYAARLYNDCLDGALHALGEARVYHFLLEDIYKNAMDFAALGGYVKGFFEGDLRLFEF